MSNDKTTTTVNIDVEPDGEIDITVLETVAGGVAMPTLTKKPVIDNDWAAQTAGHHPIGVVVGTAVPVQPGDAHGSVSTTLVQGETHGITVTATAGASGDAGSSHTNTSFDGHASGQAGVNETISAGPLTINEQAGASGNATFHAGITGVTGHVGGQAGASETISVGPAALTESAGVAGAANLHIGPTGITVTAGGSVGVNVNVEVGHVVSAGESVTASGQVHGSVGPTGIGVGAEGQASLVISAGETEAVHGHGITASQTTQVSMGAFAQGNAEANLGRYTGADGEKHIGIQAGANAMVGDAITVSEGGSISGHGVSVGGTISATDPGEVGVKFGGGADISHGELTLNIHGAVGFALAGLGGSETIGINIKPLENLVGSVAHGIEHAALPVLEHTVAPVLEHAATTAVHDITSAAHVVAPVLEHAAATVVHDVSSAAHTVESGISSAAQTVEHALHSY